MIMHRSQGTRKLKEGPTLTHHAHLALLTWLGQSRPESTVALALPAGDGVSLDIEQRAAPARPPAAQSDPKHSIEGCQNGSLTFSLEGHELQPQRGIFDGDGLVTAEEESDKPDNGEKEFGHLYKCSLPPCSLSTRYTWTE